MEVTELPTGKNRSQEQTVKELERMLKQAKAGKLDSLACVYIEDGEPMFSYTTLKSACITIGSLTRLILKVDRDDG